MSSIAKKIEKLKKRKRTQQLPPSFSDVQDAETDENSNNNEETEEEPKKRKRNKKTKRIGSDLPWKRVDFKDLNADLDAMGASGLIEEIDADTFFKANPELKDKPVEVLNDTEEAMNLDEDEDGKPKVKKEKKKKKPKNDKPKESKTEKDATQDAEVEEFEQPQRKELQIPTEPPKCLKSEWGSFNLDYKFLYAIDDLGFEAPTPIQQKSIPAALRDRKDIVGAAETGSGKTLAFGLPILQQLLEQKEKENRAKSFQPESNQKEDKRLQCLILTPTRELAIQICQHLKVIAKYTSIKVIPVIGGISVQKQHRLLKGQPEIVVATPGRFWELTNGVESHEFLSDLSSLRYLVLDEADRMIETGHYKELFYILENIKQTEATRMESDLVTTVFRKDHEEEENGEESKKKGKKKVPRQTFLFSATLTMKIQKGKIVRSRSDTSIDKLLDVMSFERKIELIDLSTKEMLAATLSEHRIDCLLEDKDIYLYYVLQFFGGARTLVFVNSISTMKRLLPLLQLLQFNVCGLHAQMQQKQRLKNLERFQSQLNSVLVATDVAARGLDIPLVDHVIHYQLPKVPQMYVHRSGRAGRAQQKGTVVALVSPEDQQQYQTILKSLSKADDIPLFEVDASFINDIRERVELARQVEHELYLLAKENSKSRDWLEKTANEELDMVSSTKKGGEDEEEEYNRNRHVKYINSLKNQLKNLLKQPLTNKANIRVLPVKQQEKSKKAKSTNFTQVNNSVTMTSLPFVVVKERYKGSKDMAQAMSNARKGIRGDKRRRGKRTGSKNITYS